MRNTTKFSYPIYPTENGYLTEKIKLKYISSAIAKNILPQKAHRIANIVSLFASNDILNPIQFWQLHSVIGQNRIVNIVKDFYERVYNDEKRFSSIFSQIAGIEHHINSQSSMWIDVMGGGPTYQGGEYRLNFHHTHNASQLMNEKGAARWMKLMIETLNDSTEHLTEDKRVRISINTFLTHFFAKYAEEFKFGNTALFGNTNAAIKRKINFLNITSDAVEALTERELKGALISHGIDVSSYKNKKDLVNKALRL